MAQSLFDLVTGTPPQCTMFLPLEFRYFDVRSLIWWLIVLSKLTDSNVHSHYLIVLMFASLNKLEQNLSQLLHVLVSYPIAHFSSERHWHFARSNNISKAECNRATNKNQMVCIIFRLTIWVWMPTWINKECVLPKLPISFPQTVCYSLRYPSNQSHQLTPFSKQKSWQEQYH